MTTLTGSNLVSLRRRPRTEQSALRLLRRLADNALPRNQAHQEILMAGGAKADIVAIARLIEAALAAGYDIRRVDAPYASPDELTLVGALARRQRLVNRRSDSLDPALAETLADAARAFDAIGLHFSSLSLGIGPGRRHEAR